MKKIMIVFPAIICLILSLCVPVVSYGLGGSYFKSFDECKQREPNKELYFYMTYQVFHGSVGSADFTWDDNTFFMAFNSSAEIEVKDSVIYVYDRRSSGYLYSYTGTTGSGGMSYLDGRYFAYNLKTQEFFVSDSEITSSTSPKNRGTTVVTVDTNLAETEPEMPDVTVNFTPDLSGNVDRSVLSSSGSKSLLQELNMKVTNNSSYPVQYRMTITLKNQTTNRLQGGGNGFYGDNKGYYESRFDDDPIFVYYSKSYVYQVVGEHSSQEDLNVQDVAKFYKATDWHYLNSGQTDDIMIDFSMINLTENCEYVCNVLAYKCDYDCASACIYNPENNDNFPASPVFKQVDTTYFIEAYNSTFIMLQYSDVKYDPNKKSGDVLPYDGSKGISSAKQYQYSYDSKTDLLTGDEKIGHVDLYNDPNSWINKKPTSYPSGFPGSSSGSGDFSVTSFSGIFSNVFGFVSMFMNYLPSSIMSIFIFGFSCIIVIAVIKAVR